LVAGADCTGKAWGALPLGSLFEVCQTGVTPGHDLGAPAGGGLRFRVRLVDRFRDLGAFRRQDFVDDLLGDLLCSGPGLRLAQRPGQT
jgi:hypothetical protein